MGLKNILVIIFLLAGLNSSANAPDIKDIRLKFHHSTTDEETCKSLIKLLEPYNESNNPLLMGYKAGATMLMAKHVFNPFSKLNYFNKGKSMLEKAIHSDKNNVELRFLRYTIQTNVPSFLGYNQNKETDRKFLNNSLGSIKDAQLKKVITSYLKQERNE